MLGGGSNLVISDGGFAGTVVHVATRGFTAYVPTGRRSVRHRGGGRGVGRGRRRAVAPGRGGVECLSGIPGLSGATPMQNVGAYGQDVSQTVRGPRPDRTAGRQVPRARSRAGLRLPHERASRAGRRGVLGSRSFAAPSAGMSAPIRYAELARAARRRRR